MVLRRFLVIASTAALIAVFAAWWRQRNETTSTTEPPEWPPLAAVPTTATDDPTGPSPAWVDGSDGEAPAGYPVKLKLSSGIFHVPGGRFYERTNPDRWYATAEAAIADGYRQSKS